ncbi:amidase [Apiospora rasikravindrae]|uniref:Amidase n=1 Tax=Apiospora rasikravindrae TaxID=990691 RepID=A0ABR1S069_9PEZI
MLGRMLWHLVLLLAFSSSSQSLELDAPYFPLREYADSAQLFPMQQCGSFQLEEATIDQMQAAMENGTLTSVQLVTCYMIRNYQTQEYANSLLQLNPDALAIAAARDAERQAGQVRGPLHGIPFTVKDNIASKDKLETTAGSWALLGSTVPRDAHVIARLREAGAVLFGKATLSEWADMRSNNYSEGYSARGGQARSAYNLTVNPGGSSSGSAIGVAINAIAFSIGTETDGSSKGVMLNTFTTLTDIVQLSTPRNGTPLVIPESEHQDSVGTFGRTVRDAVYALDAIYGEDARDNYTFAQRGKTPPGGYAQFFAKSNSLKDATFGLPWQSFWVHADEEQQTALRSLLSLIESAGATIINGTEVAGYERLVSPGGWDWDYGSARGSPNESEYTVVKVDFYNNIQAYLAELNNTDMKSLEDIVQYNYDNDGGEGGRPWPAGNPAFYSGQDGFLASLATRGVQDETYWQALNFTQASTRAGLDAALTYRGQRLSGLLVPPDVGQTYQIAAQAGHPMLTVPAGVQSSTGMPFGLAIMQTAWGEAELVRWASAIEDLQLKSDTAYQRTLPRWHGYLQRNIPVR